MIHTIAFLYQLPARILRPRKMAFVGFVTLGCVALLVLPCVAQQPKKRDDLAQFNKAPEKDISGFSRDTEGWYFYKEKYPAPPPPPAPPPEPPPPTPAPPPEKKEPSAPPLRPMSVAWIQKYMPIVREAAIDDPSPNNLRMLLYMQRVMLDKAENFTKSAVLVGNSDPSLNEDVRVPRATALAQAQSNRVRRARLAALRGVNRQVALWVFVDSKCIYCETGIAMARMLAQEHNYELRLISIDGKVPKGAKPGEIIFDVGRQAFKRFGLKVVPATVLAAPPDKIGVISQGAISDLETLQQATLSVLLSLKLVPDELRAVLETRDRGLLTPENFRQVEGDLTLAAKGRSESDAGGAAPPEEAKAEDVVRFVSALIDKQVKTP